LRSDALPLVPESVGSRTQERESVPATLHYAAQSLAVSAKQLDPEEGRDFKHHSDPGCGCASLDVPKRNGRDASALSEGVLGPPPEA